MAPFVRAAPKKRLAEMTDKPKSKPLSVAQPTRLGFGEYFHPTLFNKAALYARFEFLAKIEQLAPKVLVDLAESVRPAYEQLRSTIEEAELLSLNSEALRKRAESDRNEFATLLKSLDEWLEGQHLNADWVRDTALATLFGWTGRVIQGHQLRFGSPPYSAVNPLRPDELLFSFSDYGWTVTNETRNRFVARVRAEFESTLAGYISRIEDRLEEQGWKKTPEIRKAENDSDSFRHFEWLVRWQCQGWTTTQIAKKYGLGNQRKAISAKKSAAIRHSGARAEKGAGYAVESDRRRKAAYRTVHDGLTKAAHLLDLPLRPGKEPAENNSSQ
jgi:hypothetical protein